MRQDRIRTALARYLRKESDTIILEVLEGKPCSSEGGVWIEAQVEDMEKVTEDPAFDPERTGWKKYLDKWFAERLITARERNTGKS